MGRRWEIERAPFFTVSDEVVSVAVSNITRATHLRGWKGKGRQVWDEMGFYLT